MSFENHIKHPWQERAEARRRLVEDYKSRFMHISTIYSESVKEGYDLDLMRYVGAVAMVQAEMMIPEPSGIGWNGVIILGINTTITPAMKKHFFAEQKRQADTGTIDIAIPTGHIADWKSMREWLSRAPVKKDKKPAVEAVRTALDAEIERQLQSKVSA